MLHVILEKHHSTQLFKTMQCYLVWRRIRNESCVSPRVTGRQRMHVCSCSALCSYSPRRSFQVLPSLPPGIVAGVPNSCLLSWCETGREPWLLTSQMLVLPTVRGLLTKQEHGSEIRRFSLTSQWSVRIAQRSTVQESSLLCVTQT